jgi:hypothetical protein
MPILGIMASAMSANLWQPQGAYDALSTASPTSGSSVVFAGIPASYKHLQIRISAVLAGAGQSIYTRFNGVSASSNYYNHWLAGNGSTASAGTGPTSALYAAVGGVSGSVTTYPNVAIVDILDYANTSKNKVQRSLTGADNNSTGGSVELESGLWLSTNAINAIEVYTGSTYASGTTMTLYGIR